MNKPTKEQFITAYKRLPLPVREYMADPDLLGKTLIEIRDTHGLHIDVAGALNELVNQMLLGLVSPSQFLGGLLMSGIPEPEAREIMKEINEKIFMPLQEEMRKGPAAATQEPARPVSALQPSYNPPPPPPVQVRPAQPPVPPAPVGQMRTAESDLASAIAHAREHPPAAPLPPRGALPGASARAPGQPIFHHPLPTRPSQSLTPTNLPTGAAPYGGGTSTEEFPSLPPLVKPPTAPLSSTPEDAIPPHTRYPNDPYREPVE